MRKFIDCSELLTYSGLLSLENLDGQGMSNEWKKVGVLSNVNRYTCRKKSL